MSLTNEQVKEVINWMNTWEQLRGTAIPMRFKEDFKPIPSPQSEQQLKEWISVEAKKYTKRIHFNIPVNINDYNNSIYDFTAVGDAVANLLLPEIQKRDGENYTLSAIISEQADEIAELKEWNKIQREKIAWCDDVIEKSDEQEKIFDMKIGSLNQTIEQQKNEIERLKRNIIKLHQKSTDMGSLSQYL